MNYIEQFKNADDFKMRMIQEVLTLDSPNREKILRIIDEWKQSGNGSMELRKRLQKELG